MNSSQPDCGSAFTRVPPAVAASSSMTAKESQQANNLGAVAMNAEGVISDTDTGGVRTEEDEVQILFVILACKILDYHKRMESTCK